ncbi:hypothetical protein SKAU_G00164360 [Synaphobranchus kaupii]|uniref:Uncharacterized protein n=1 Tax=Synaphobranchus kaupii TaxID=118154 RepID=A0A9Q1IZ71_SYNKA|nr:hypothetical protein SKAU_G00164360 [Synaphobranchus kaupii]
MGSFVFFALLFLGCGLGALPYKLFMNEWSMLILTHHWPETFCNMVHCKTDIGYWTLHGLWTNKGDTCNSSWHFNASLIEDLMPQIRKWWPDLIHPVPSPATAFWKHEWVKHGTCAAQSQPMNTEHKYFSKALELYNKLDLDGALRIHNIVPSETYYSLDDIEGAIISFYKVKPKIQCIHPATEEPMQILGQIEICFDTEFTLVSCYKTEEDITSHPNNVLTFYPYGKTGIDHGVLPSMQFAMKNYGSVQFPRAHPYFSAEMSSITLNTLMLMLAVVTHLYVTGIPSPGGGELQGFRQDRLHSAASNAVSGRAGRLLCPGD